MRDDLIDDSGFELGRPFREEMLKHQCDLLYDELETPCQDLRKTDQKIELPHLRTSARRFLFNQSKSMQFRIMI